MKYRKRPVEVEAIRWTGQNVSEIGDFTGGHRTVAYDATSHSLFVATLGGQVRCAAGDWLVRGVGGDYYPCKDAAFEETYEALDVLETA